MEDRETARMRKYGESKTTRIMMATVPHVTSGLGLRKSQADGFLLTQVYYCGIFLVVLFSDFARKPSCTPTNPMPYEIRATRVHRTLRRGRIAHVGRRFVV